MQVSSFNNNKTLNIFNLLYLNMRAYFKIHSDFAFPNVVIEIKIKNSDIVAIIEKVHLDTQKSCPGSSLIRSSHSSFLLGN